MAKLEPGAQFSGLTIEAVIGQGSMGVIYRARDPQLDRVVALKVIADHIAADAEFRQRFMYEARLAATVEHPGIVPIYATGEQDGVPFLSMRLVEGVSLQELIAQRGRLHPREALALLRPIADALDAAATAGVLHRDVKPANILIPTNGPGAVLIDFGIGRAADSTRSTQTGGWLGTVLYLAPERVRDEGVGPASDQYSLACVFFEAVTGHAPYDKDDLLSTLFAHANEPIPIAATSDPQLDHGINEVMRIALAKDPQARFGSCGAFFTALATVMDGTPYTTSAPAVSPENVAGGTEQTSTHAPEYQAHDNAMPPPAGTATPTRSRVLPIAAAVGVGAVAVLIIAVVAFSLRDAPTSSEGLAVATSTSEAQTVAEPVTLTEPETSEPEPEPVPTRRRTVQLSQQFIPPSSPYRCVSPTLIDHSGRVAYVAEYPNGRRVEFASDGRRDFILCGGSTTRNRPGLASGTIQLAPNVYSERVLSVQGTFGRDFDDGVRGGGAIGLTVLYEDRVVCRFRTDGSGHARNFNCRKFPQQSDLGLVKLRLSVNPDDDYGVFAGIGGLKAVVEVAR